MDRMLPGLGSRLWGWDETWQNCRNYYVKGHCPMVPKFPLSKKNGNLCTLDTKRWRSRFKIPDLNLKSLETEWINSEMTLGSFAYLPFCHWLSPSFTQLLITSTGWGHLCVLCQESPQSYQTSRSCWPQHKDSKEDGSSFNEVWGPLLNLQSEACGGKTEKSIRLLRQGL